LYTIYGNAFGSVNEIVNQYAGIPEFLECNGKVFDKKRMLGFPSCLLV
uniref:Glutathione S-transferase n=1 Tax=Brugia timori TaxID=42155 RepID=A0A0R3QEB9_9BILA